MLLAGRLAGDLASFVKKAWTILHPDPTAGLELALRPALRVPDRRPSAQDDAADHQRPAAHREVDDRDDLLSVLGLGERPFAELPFGQLLPGLVDRALGHAPQPAAERLVSSDVGRQVPAWRVTATRSRSS